MMEVISLIENTELLNRKDLRTSTDFPSSFFQKINKFYLILAFQGT